MEIPELGAKTTAMIGEDGRAQIQMKVEGLERWWGGVLMVLVRDW